LIDEVQRRLAGKFVQLSPDQIAAAVAQVHARFEHSRVRDFVPLLWSDAPAGSWLDRTASSPRPASRFSAG
jgi:hypothetical protein